MKMNLHCQLNEQQLRAVTTIKGPILVIAGAGSGKTRVITYRIAYMLDQGIKQSEVLAVTFTNKAANEMKNRVKELTQKRLSGLTISTFHSFGVSILREFGHLLGLKKSFSIYDQTDKYSLLKELIEEYRLNISGDIKYISGLFSNIKIGSASIEEEGETYRELFKLYEEHLKAYNAVDFDDLLVKSLELLKLKEVLNFYQNRYRYFMVDEFQDTSLIQYAIIKKLAEKYSNLCVVGDDDQSIYSWRGANYENIRSFESDFPDHITIKLEHNYRSTPIILGAANELIKHNQNRKSKFLRAAEKNQGYNEPITVVYPENEREEGLWIAEKIRTFAIKYGLKFHDFGVLVRTNQLTRYIEEAFLKDNIPYQVSGGISFFQRKEIKDIIAYMRVISNPDDNVSLLRIINTPRRGIGSKTVEILVGASEESNTSIYSLISKIRTASNGFDIEDKIDKRTRDSLVDFITIIDYYREQILKGREMAKHLKSLVEKINYWGYLLSTNKKQEVAKWKYHNIISLIDSLAEYEKDPDTIHPSIYEYLNRITLTTKDESGDIKNEKVNLMTIHSAKGLEFEVVFIAGVEDGIIPHSKSEADGARSVEEERRLFYVAITRAKKLLLMSACKTRKKMGKLITPEPSPFLEEIPPKYFTHEETEEVASRDDARTYFENLKKMFVVNK